MEGLLLRNGGQTGEKAFFSSRRRRTGRVEDPTLQTTTPPHTMDDLRKRQQCVSHRNLGSEKCFGAADGWGDDGRIGAGSWGSDAIGAFLDPRSPEVPTAIRGQCLCAKPWSCHFRGGEAC